MHKITPLGPCVLVRPERAEERTSSGLIIPQTAQEAPLRGEVLAKGSGFKHIRRGNLTVGDIVLYQRYGVTEINADGEDLLIVPEEHLLAVLERAVNGSAESDEDDDEVY